MWMIICLTTKHSSRLLPQIEFENEMRRAKTISYNENSFAAEAIYENVALYRFLLFYYYPDLQEPDIDSEIRSSPDMRWTICQYIASWLPWDRHYEEIKRRCVILSVNSGLP